MPLRDIMSISKSIFTKSKNLLIEKLKCILNIHKLKNHTQIICYSYSGKYCHHKSKYYRATFINLDEFYNIQKRCKMVKVSYQL